MRPGLIYLVAIFGLVGRATADIPPPPPPDGSKYVAVAHEVVLGRDIKGYTFVESVSGFGDEPALRFRKLQLPPGKAVAITQPARRVGVVLFAVADAHVANYKTDEALFQALADLKIEDVPSIGFDNSATIKATDKRDRVKWTHTILAIDEKNQIVTKVDGDGYREVTLPADVPMEGNVPAGGLTTSESRLWIAGIALAFAIVGMGLWFARRNRNQTA